MRRPACTCGIADGMVGGSHEPTCAIEGGREADDNYWANENTRLAQENDR